MIRSLSAIRRTLNDLHPDNQEKIVEIGTALEETLSRLPEGAETVSELLVLSLNGLQAAYHQTVSDFSKLKSALEVATVAAEQALAAPQNPVGAMMVEQAASALRALLGHETEMSQPDAGGSETPALNTIDDMISFVMQLEPDDQVAFAQMRDALKTLAMQGDLPTEAKKLVIKTGKSAEKLAVGKSKDPHKTFSDVVQWLGEIGALLEPTPVASPSATPAPSPAVVPVAKPPVAAAAPPIEEKREREVEAVAPAVNTASDFGPLPADTDTVLIGEFVVESREYIESAEAALLALENDPDDLESVNTVFRAFHTVKGTSAFLGLAPITELAHHAESLLSRVRDREIRCTGGYADLALRSIDALKELIESVYAARNGASLKKPAEYDDLMRVLMNPEKAGVSAESSAPVKASAPRTDAEPSATDASGGENAGGARATASGGHGDRNAESFMRVRTDRLDRLIDMVGELVIAQSMIAQDDVVLSGAHLDLTRKAAHAGKIVRELQDLSMGMRMVPLKATFQKMARLVRDVAQKSGKIVEFVTEGEDTEIDRNMVEVVSDPLVHMIRNAVDHGIESPDDRISKGKSRQGVVRLSAYHASGDVVIELQDDGKGLDREKILKKAIEKGLIESDKGMSSTEVFDLIFAPGFSTADKISDISGRGVGMDVVKRSIEALQGRIHITSETGKGSVFTVRLPLTLAITDGMLVKIGDERYIIPTVNIHLSFQPNPNALSTVAGRGEMVMLRGELMPLFRLHRLFDVLGATEDPTKGLIVVVADGRRRCAFLVDELLGQQQVVAKPLGSGVGKVQGISGGAILGDGRVGLILDVPELITLGRQTAGVVERKPAAMQFIA
jgi:two-component system chemotaxis sensor kinase CheA